MQEEIIMNSAILTNVAMYMAVAGITYSIAMIYIVFIRTFWRR